MAFVEKARKGEVMGNKVVARPVPLALARECLAADSDAARIDALAKIVDACVTMEDGSRINSAEISVAAIGELGAFALGSSDGGAESVADFTQPR